MFPARAALFCKHRSSSPSNGLAIILLFSAAPISGRPSPHLFPTHSSISPHPIPIPALNPFPTHSSPPLRPPIPVPTHSPFRHHRPNAHPGPGFACNYHTVKSEPDTPASGPRNVRTRHPFSRPRHPRTRPQKNSLTGNPSRKAKIRQLWISMSRIFVQ